MPRLSTYSAIWILMLFFDLTVTENKLYPKRNISLSDFQKERVARDSSEKFWKRRLLYKNEMIEIVGPLNETSRFVNDQIAKDTNFSGKLENVMEDTKERTLIDYNGPVIIGEDLDNKSDQDFADHVRVKRNEPTNDSIIRHQLNHSVNIFDSSPRNFWSNTDETNVYGGSTFDFATIVNIPYLRHKRGVLSKKNRQHGKRIKRNIRHSKHRVGTENRKKKHDTLKSSRKPAKKKANNSKKSSKKAETVSAKMMSKSRIEKRESRNDSLNTDLARTSITDYDKRKEDAVALPFVHTGRAELRVRIEKIPRNESSFVSNWTDRSIGTSTCRPTALLKYDDEIVDANATDRQLVPNFDSTGREKFDNLTVEIIVKKLDYGNNVSSWGTSDSGNASFYNAVSHPIGSDLSRIKDDRDLESGKYNRAKISSDEDAKSRAKRNQEITSSRYLRSDRNTMIGSKPFKNEQRTSIEDIKHKKTKHKSRGNRAVKSIEEIKELAEKLMVKVNELQMYVNERNETRYTTSICVDDANRVATEGTSRISSEKKHIARVSEIADNHRHLARNSGQVTLAGRRASSRMPSSGSRFARGENPIQRNTLRRKWGRWMDWSSCSVTCGKGRQIRWRHCLHDCDDAETEMEEKACQLPACPPGKFLGIF
ncbi:SCO-spondin [Formica fusca]